LPASPFHNKENNIENPNCNYNSVFNGTSSSAPMISASIALLLEVNPNLTWREIKYILAKTATQIDTNSKDVVIPLNNGDYIARSGWTTNAKGFNFHTHYGFGKMNIDKAIKLAKTLKTNPIKLGTLVSKSKTSDIDMEISKSDKNGLETSITTNTNINIETIKIQLDLDYKGGASTNDYYTGDIAIELYSPQKTKSIILSPYSIQSAGSFTEKTINKKIKNLRLISNAFYNENTNSKWTLKIINTHKKHSITLKKWKIIFYGNEI